jgi:hypothetical protein
MLFASVTEPDAGGVTVEEGPVVPRAARWVLFGALAVAVHAGALAVVHGSTGRRRPMELPAMEVELQQPSLPAAPAPPPAAPPRDSRLSGKVAKAQAPAAHAGRIAAIAEARDSAEPVDFVSDPNGKSFGSGVVAVGGSAEHGAGAQLTRGPTSAIAAEADLSRRARLAEADACRGYYPRTARSDKGVALLAVSVRSTGVVAAASIVSESPMGEGFGQAALECLGRKVFQPAADLRGRAVDSVVRLNVRFTR